MPPAWRSSAPTRRRSSRTWGRVSAGPTWPRSWPPTDMGSPPPRSGSLPCCSRRPHRPALGPSSTLLAVITSGRSWPGVSAGTGRSSALVNGPKESLEAGTVPRPRGKRPRRGAVQRLGAVLAPLALAALLAGCVHPSDSGGGSGSGGSASTAGPSAEDTNPDSSAGQDGHRGSGVSLSLAGLPAGSGGALKDTCFNINWTGDQVEIPAGDSISIGVAPDGNFGLTDATGGGCGWPDCHQVTWT